MLVSDVRNAVLTGRFEVYAYYGFARTLASYVGEGEGSLGWKFQRRCSGGLAPGLNWGLVGATKKASYPIDDSSSKGLLS